MAAGRHDITAEQGETFEYFLTYEDPNGTPVDLTGYTARMQVRESFKSTATIADIGTDERGGITLGGADGTIQLVIDKASLDAVVVPVVDSTYPPVKSCVYDLVLQTGETFVKLMSGLFNIRAGVTK